MPIPKLKKWKSWYGVEVEGPLRGKDTVFVIDNKADSTKMVTASHLYLCPEVTSLKNLSAWVNAVRPSVITVSLPLNQRISFALKVKKFCCDNSIVFNYQVFASIPEKMYLLPNTVRLDYGAFLNTSYEFYNSLTPKDYQDDKRLE